MPKRDEYDMDLEGKLTTAHKVIEDRLTALWSSIDTIDTKTNIILGFASIILILFAGFYSLGIQSLGSKALPVICVVLFSIALVAYIVLLVLSILSYRIRDWSYRPDPTTLIENSKNGKYTKAVPARLLAVLAICQASAPWMEQTCQAKTKWRTGNTAVSWQNSRAYSAAFITRYRLVSPLSAAT